MFILSIFLFAYANFAQCEGKEQTNINSSQYKYYTGRGSSSKSSAEAAKVAEEDARSKAVKDNYGSSFRVQQSNFIDLQQSISETRTEEFSQSTYLKGFERIKEKVEKNSLGLYEVQIDFRYSRIEIENEKKRLRNTNTETVFNESGASGCPPERDTTLVLTTNKLGAVVTLEEGEVLGKTPLKIICQLPAGEPLKVTLDHPNFEIKTENLVINTGQTLDLKVNLVPATTSVSFVTQPTDADIWLDGKLISKTPTTPQAFAVGSKHQVMFVHKETEKLAIEFDVPRQQEAIQKEYQLSYKPAFFSIKLEPKDATIVLNNSLVDQSFQGRYPCDPRYGEVELRLFKEGYSTQFKKFQCVGDKTTRLGIVRLSKEKPEEAVKANEPLLQERANLLIDLELMGQGLPFDQRQLDHYNIAGFSIGWGLSLSWSPHDRFALGIATNISVFSGDEEDVTGTPSSNYEIASAATLFQTSVFTSVNILDWMAVYGEYGVANIDIKYQQYSFDSQGQGSETDINRSEKINGQKFYGGGISFSDNSSGFSLIGKLGFRSYNLENFEDRIAATLSGGIRYGF